MLAATRIYLAVQPESTNARGGTSNVITTGADTVTTAGDAVKEPRTIQVNKNLKSNKKVKI